MYITRSALVGMQLIQVCIWSVVIVTAENSTLTLPLHRPPTKQTNIQASGRTNKRTKWPSKQSPPLLGNAYQLQRYDFWKQFFKPQMPLLESICLTVWTWCDVSSNHRYKMRNIQAPFRIKSVQCRRLDVAKCSRIQGLAVIRFISH